MIEPYIFQNSLNKLWECYIGEIYFGSWDSYEQAHFMASEHMALWTMTHNMPTSKGYKSDVTEFERNLILTALILCKGNKLQAAKKLGIKRTTLQDKCRRFNLKFNFENISG